MIILLKRKFINFAIFTLGTFLLECISFSFMGWGFLPVYFFLDLLIIALLGSLVFLFKNTLFDCIYLPIIMFISTCLFCLNANYYVATGSIFAIQDFQLLFRADKVIGTVMKFLNVPILATEFSLFSVLMFTILFLNIKFKVKTNKKIKKDKAIIFGAVLAILTAGFVYPITLYLTSGYEKNINNNRLINIVNVSKNYNYQRLGMFTYYIKDILATYFSNGSVTENSFYDYCHSSKTETNDFTGLLKGYNVITIMIETGARMMLNETLTPNLWYLTQNGIDCTHNYMKNNTNISEYIGIVGNYTTDGLQFNNFTTSVPFSMPKMLNDYNSVYCHDVGVQCDIYSRHSYMNKLGFKNVILHEQLNPSEPEWDWNYYSFDSENTKHLIELVKDIKAPNYIFYSTLTMHGPYEVHDTNKKYFQTLENLYGKKINDAEKNKQWINPLARTRNESSVRNYMLKVMDFDAGLGILLAYLKGTNKLDKTLITLYGDHDVYYDAYDEAGRKIPLSFLIYGKNNLEEIALYNTMLTFFNPSLNEKYFEKYHKHTYDEFTSASSVVPSLLDLLGIKYNENLYLNKSIFNIKKETNIMYSFLLSAFLNENYFTNDGNKIAKTFNENGTHTEFIKKSNSIIDRLLNFNYLYKTNFFSNHKYDLYL